MKKLISLLLAIMLIASMSITAFAASADDSEGLLYGDNAESTSDSDVTVKMSGTIPAATVYYVNVTWKALEFAYSFQAGVTWDPENHQYVADTDTTTVGTWKWTAGTTDENDDAVGTASGFELNDAITVTNHSNATVNVVAGFVTTETNGTTSTNASMTTNGVTAEVENGGSARQIKTAEGTAVANAPSIAYTLNVSGTPNTDTGFKLGTITVTVSEVVTNPDSGTTN